MSNNKEPISIKIKLTEDHMMNLVSNVIEPYIVTKMKKTKIENKLINIQDSDKLLLKNIYINSLSRLSTTLHLENTLKRMRVYYKDTEDEILIQKIIIQMMNQLPNKYTIIETGICIDSENVKHIYGIFLDKEIVSFILRNKELIENIYFSNNPFENSNSGIFLYENNIFISEENGLFNNVIPKSMINNKISQRFGGNIIPSLAN